MDRGHFFFAGRVEGRDQPRDDGLKDLLLRPSQRAGQAAGRNDGVMVAHFAIVDDPAGEPQRRQVQAVDVLLADGLQAAQDVGDLPLHIAAQVARVGTRVGDQFLLVQRLSGGQRVGGGQAVTAVHVPLEFRQIVQLGRLRAFLLAVDLGDGQRLAEHLGEHLLGGCLLLEPVAREPEQRLAVLGQQFPKRFRLESADFVVPLDDQRQHRRLDAAHAPQDAVGAEPDGVVPRAVHAHDPVRFAAALGRRVQVVVFAAGLQLPERLADRAVGQRTEPQPADRLPLAAGHRQDVAEDQFPFASGIRRTDDLAGGAKQLLDDRELLAGVLFRDQLQFKRLQE